MKQVTDLQLINVYTIGHGNRKTGDFISLLKQYQIQVLIDVRTYPYSRFHPQFRQNDLQKNLEAAGIAYIFLGKELGGRPENPELYTNGKADYDLIKETSLFKSGITQVLDLAKQNIKVTLMCSESDQDHCHRKHLIADELIKEGITVWHIDKAGKLVKHQYEINQSLFN